MILILIRIDESIVQLQAEIIQLQETLERERKIRKNKDEYDVIAKEILKLPTIEALYQSCVESEAELANLATQQAAIQEKIEANANCAFDAIDELKDLRRRIENDIKNK